MIKKRREKNGDVRLTFAIESDRPVSLVCDRNDWDPGATPLVRRTNGMRSASLLVPEGTPVRFRYFTDNEYFDDQDADLEPNGLGGTHSLVVA